MSVFLFIKLPHTWPIQADTKIQWLRWDDKKGCESDRGQASINELCELVHSNADQKESTNILIAPGESIRSINVNLPNKSKAALSTIPFQIEEHVSCKIEDLHIASGAIEDKQITSLVVEHHLMQQWLDFIKDSHIKFRYLLSDYSLLPSFDRMGSAWSDGKSILVKSYAFQGTLSPLAFERFQADFWPNLSEQLTFYTQSNFVSFFPQSTTRVNADLLGIMAQSFVETRNANFINLLQGQYQQTNHNVKKLKAFKAPAIAFALLLISFLALAITDNLQLAKQNNHLKQQMTQLYKQLFPNDKRINDPYRQMRGKLKRGNQTNSQNFLPWMATIAPLIKQHQISLVNLKYDLNPLVLRLQITAADYNALENIARQLNQQQKTAFLASLGTLQKSSTSQTVTSILTIKEK